MTDSKPYLSDDPPTYMGDFMNIIPLFREFDSQKPTHMGGTYPYQQYAMYPAPGLLHLEEIEYSESSWMPHHKAKQQATIQSGRTLDIFYVNMLKVLASKEKGSLGSFCPKLQR